MTTIIGPTQTQAQATFCPKCFSPSIKTQVITLSGGGGMPAHCTACGWTGASTDLVATQFKHEFKSDDEIAEVMQRDLRNLLSKTAAQTYGSFLLKWGFLDKPISAYQLATYLEAISKSVATTVIETRKKLVEEKAHERTGVERASGPTGPEGR